MKTQLTAVGLVLMYATMCSAQPRILSLNGGELVWSNNVYRALYSIESAASPSGPWVPLRAAEDMDLARTNLTAVSVPLTNTAAFFRVQWKYPDPVGRWNYQAFDSKGGLALTGVVHVMSMVVETTTWPRKFTLLGVQDVAYAGAITNNLAWLGNQVGRGYFRGSLDPESLAFAIWWPTNCADCQTGFEGVLGADILHNARWGDSTIGGTRWRGAAVLTRAAAGRR